MNDDRLNALLRLAIEAEALDAPAPRAVPRARKGAVILRRIGGWMAVAAAATLAFVVVLGRVGSPGPTPPLATSAGPPTVMPAPTKGEPAMLLALFRGADSACECVVWREAHFGGRAIGDVAPSELVEAVLKDPCAASRGDLLLVVGLQGPREHLPPTQEAARVLANCLATGTDHCGEDVGCNGAGAASCIPAGVSIATGTLAMNTRP
jgi:hypothetical protein